MATSPDIPPAGRSDDRRPSRDSWPISDPDRFRTAVRHWVTANWTTGISVREWWRRLGTAGLSVPTWSPQLGGIGATTAIQQIIEAEFARIGTVAPPLAGVGVQLVGPVIRQFATPEQQRSMLPGIVEGTANWCLLVDEPAAITGSPDISATATRVSGGWVVDAVKFSVEPELADRGLLVVRTDPNGPGRDATSCFALTLDQPTVNAQRLPDGRAVVVMRGARVGDADLIGRGGDGWAIAQTVLAHQRTSLAGRIRRGLVEVTSGERAGNLDRTTGDVLTYATATGAAPRERRRQR